MLYGNESISHYTRSNVVIWMSMAFQAGVLNVGGFLACRRFVSHVTGYGAYFGTEIMHAGHRHAAGMLVVPLCFLLGVMISGVLVDLRLKRHVKPKYYLVFGLIFALLLVVLIGGVTGKFGVFGRILENRRDYNLLMLLCLICGIQNGTVSTVSRSVIRTTHLTGITTDLGVGLIRVFNRKKIKDPLGDESKANWMRIGIILFFYFGAMAGAYLFMHYEYYGFILPTFTSGILFVAMYYFQFFKPQILTLHRPKF